jgi:hypothetical protein
MSTDIQPRRLATLADEIRAELDAADGAFHRGLQHAIAAGEKLIEAKSLTHHGEWIPWLEANFPFTRQWGSACMRVAKAARQGEIEMEFTGSISAALAQIAEPKALPASATNGAASATNLFGEPDSRMQENGDDWRARLLREQGIGKPAPEGLEPAPADKAPVEDAERVGDVVEEVQRSTVGAPSGAWDQGEPKAAGEVLDDPLSGARKRYSSAASRAFRDNDKAAARQALAVWRQELKPALEQVARDGIEIDRSRWRR